MNQTIVLDSQVVVTESVKVDSFQLDTDYSINGSSLTWLSESLKDSITIQYRVVFIETSYRNKNPDIIEEIYEENPFKYIPPNTFKSNNYGTLKTMGNVSRGIGFGNAQDVVVNSNLNLRLSGKLANDIDILAVISDENNPIQPEGNTQQIQDFDQVYITLKKDSGKLTLGDFLMQHPKNSYFINYYKKSRGLQFQNVYVKDEWKVNYSAEAAISRGRFSRNKIDGIEGNSGPYRLAGSNGEIFIVIIAGTENVYLDGKKLTRGEDNDYVINYNTGEITFTPQILITRYSRIVVEFQYSDRNYARSVARLGTSVKKGNYTVYTNFFNEMDLRSQPYQQSLEGYDSIINKSALEILAEAGDNQAFFNNVRPQTTYNAERIMYKRIVSVPEDYYEYAQDPDENTQFFEVSFSNVGFGNGSYSQAQTAANGKVFEYVGVGLGDYEPIEILIAPKRLSTINVGFMKEEKGRTSGIEYALSGYDQNTISTLDDNDNKGFGLRLYRKTEGLLKDSSEWKVKSNLNYEMVSGQYNYVERYRDVEFDRKWNKVLSNPNALSELLPSYEHIANADISISKSASQYFSNSASGFIRPGSFQGASNITKVGFQLNKIKSATTVEVMSSQTNSDSTSLDNIFYSLQTELIRPIWKFIGGGSYHIEKSSFLLSDSLLGNSYGYDNMSLFIKNSDTSKVKYLLSGAQRTDNRPKNEGFKLATIGRDINFKTAYTSKKSNRFELNSTYRQLQIKDTTLSSKAIENTFQSRIEFDFYMWKKFIRSKTFYQLGTGQEQRREFQYLQVQAGNGIYIWNDYDSNGLKTLNEFEIASDLDKQRADYIKIFTPVAGFFTTNSNKISQTLELRPAVFLKKGKKKKPLWSRFNSLSTLILDQKILPTTVLDLLNPFQQNISDTSLISSSQNFRSTLFFNRSNPKYSLDYTYIENSSKVLLTNGFDSRRNQDNLLNSRINFGKKFSLLTKLMYGDRLYVSQFFANRSFNYQFIEVEPKLQVILKQALRIELKSKYFLAENLVQYGGEVSENIEIGTELKYTKAGKGTVQLGGSFINVKYDGNTSSTLGYELLRGLQNGNNATWKFSYQQTLANNIQLIINYDGRKSEDAPVIHIGRLMARYLF